MIQLNISEKSEMGYYFSRVLGFLVAVVLTLLFPSLATKTEEEVFKIAAVFFNKL